MAGVYSYMPLGLRVLRNIEQIVREEMNAIGGTGSPHADTSSERNLGNERVLGILLTYSLKLKVEPGAIMR